MIELEFVGVPLMMLQQDSVWAVLWRHLSTCMPEGLCTETSRFDFNTNYTLVAVMHHFIPTNSFVGLQQNSVTGKECYFVMYCIKQQSSVQSTVK